jgi:hypothetical protein
MESSRAHDKMQSMGLGTALSMIIPAADGSSDGRPWKSEMRKTPARMVQVVVES